MCHALRARASSVMAARVRLKMQCGTVVLLLVVIVVVCGVDFVCGMFEHRHCNHQHPRAHEVIHDVHIEPAHEVRKRSISQPVRILLSYDESVYRLDDEKLDLINNTILPEAVHFWERALMVRETKSTIRLSSNKFSVKKGAMKRKKQRRSSQKGYPKYNNNPSQCKSEQTEMRK